MESFIGRRKWWALTVLATGLLGGLTWARGQAFSEWTIGKPIVTYQLGVPVNNPNARQMANGGWNLVQTNVRAELDVAQAHGLRVMWMGGLDNTTVNSIRNHPALYAYFVADEPSTSDFADIAATVSRLRALDPNHLAYISHTARQAGIPFINTVQAGAFGSGFRVPTGNELRWEYYTSLAYGAQGISNFVYYKAGFTGGIVLDDSTPTPLYTVATTLNREFVAIAEQLQSLDHIGAYHLGDLPRGYDTTDGSSPVRLPGNSPFQLAPGDIPDTTYAEFKPVQGAVLGLFGPDRQLTDATHTVVVNLDYSKGLNTSVKGPGNLSVFNPATGTWIAQGHAWADVCLLPGGGVLVKLTSTVPEP